MLVVCVDVGLVVVAIEVCSHSDQVVVATVWVEVVGAVEVVGNRADFLKEVVATEEMEVAEGV